MVSVRWLLQLHLAILKSFDKIPQEEEKVRQEESKMAAGGNNGQINEKKKKKHGFIESVHDSNITHHENTPI